MNRPAPHVFLLANKVARLSILGGSLYALYLATTTQISGLWALAGLGGILLRYGKRASVRVANYQTFKQAWDQAGASPANDNARRPANPRRSAMRRGIAALVWLLFGLWLLGSSEQAGTSNYTTIALGFAALTLWGAASFVRPLLRRGRGEKKPIAHPGEFIVRVCLGVPRSSPAPAEMELPDYCRALLAPPRSATTASSTH